MDLLSSNFFLPIVAVFTLTTVLWYRWALHCLLRGVFHLDKSSFLLFFKMIILARSRAKETNGTKVWCMAWLKTNSRPEGTKHHEIIFLSTRCFLLMQFSIDQPIKCERSEHSFSAEKFKKKLIFQNIIFQAVSKFEFSRQNKTFGIPSYNSQTDLSDDIVCSGFEDARYQILFNINMSFIQGWILYIK